MLNYKKMLIGGLILIAPSQYVYGDLLLQPSKCITLKQGNTCYQDIDVTWKADTTGDYCLIVENNQTALKCWTQQDSGRYQFEFSDNRSLTYKLIKMPEQRIVLENKISVKWVYKKRRNQSWRLF